MAGAASAAGQLPAPQQEPAGLHTLWVSLDHRRLADVSVLWGTLSMSQELDITSPTYTDAWHSLYLQVDAVVARHRVAKLAGGCGHSGFLLAANVLGSDDQHPQELLECGAKIMRVVRQEVRLPNGQPAELQMGMHVGEAWSGMLGTSPPHFQLWGPAVEAASSLGRQGVPGFIQASRAFVERIGGDTKGVDSRWKFGGWLQLYSGDASEVYLWAEAACQRQQRQRLLRVLANRARSDKSVAASRPAWQSQTLAFLDQGLEERFLREHDARTAVPGSRMTCAAAAAAVLWALFGLLRRGSVGMQHAAIAVLLAACAAQGLSSNGGRPFGRNRELRWCAVQAFIIYALVSDLQPSRTASQLGGFVAPTAAAVAAIAANAAAQKVRFVVHLWAGAALPLLTLLSLLPVWQRAASAPAGAEPPSVGQPQTAQHPAAAAAAVLGAVLAAIGIPGLGVYLWDSLAREAFLLGSKFD